MRYEKTVLVLGAGSSLAFGYPTGSDLTEMILSLRAGRAGVAKQAGLDISNPLFKEFIETFRRSQAYSIDAFLARRPEFSSVGKQAIGAVINMCETFVGLDKSKHEDLWQRYFFNIIAKHGFDDIDFSRLAVVTFNYDRSLEFYLYNSLKALYGADEEQ